MTASTTSRSAAATTVPVPAVQPWTDAAERGRTHIADRVVERIVARAAYESDAVTGPGGVRRLADGLTGRDDRPQVSVTVDGQVAVVRISLGVAYPEPVGRTTREVRERVRARVRELTGIDVRQVDITVTRLPVQRPRRLR